MRRLLPLLVAPVTLIVAACIDAEMALEVSDTGGVAMQTDITYPDSFLEFLAMGEEGGTEGVCAGLTEATLSNPEADLPAGVEVSTSANPCSVNIAYASDSYAEYVEAIGEETGPLRRVPLGWEFQMEYAADAFEESDDDPLVLVPRFVYRVTLPGPAGGHNAHNTTPAEGGTTFVWEFGPDAPVPEPAADALAATMYEQNLLYASSLFEHPSGTPVEAPAADTFDRRPATADPLDPDPANGTAPEEAVEPEPPASTSAPPMPATPDKQAPAGDTTSADAQTEDGADNEGTPESVDGEQPEAQQPSEESQPAAAPSERVDARSNGDGLSPWVQALGAIGLILLAAAAGWALGRRRGSGST